MKKLIVILISIISVSFVEVNAQDDTLKNLTLKKQSVTQGQIETQEQQYLQEDIEVVSHDEIPSALQNTLTQDDLYKGWENSTLYFDKRNNLYLLEMKDEITTHVYRFDHRGRPISGNVPER